MVMTRKEFDEYIKMADSEKYKVDNDFSKEPTAICDHIRLGTKACYRGEGQYCYCKLGCTSKTELNGSRKMIAEERQFLDREIKRAIAEEKRTAAGAGVGRI